MPEPYVTGHDVEEVARELEAAGYSGEELNKAGLEILGQLEQQRRSEEFGRKSTLGQLAWAGQRGFRGVGELFTGVAAGLMGQGRPLGEIWQTAREKPFEEIPSGVLPTAPRGIQFASRAIGTLARDIPLLGFMSPLVPGAGALARAGHAFPATLLRSGVSFEVLNQLEGGPAGQGFAGGLALSLIPAALRSRFPRRFSPNPMALATATGGVTVVPNPASLPAVARAAILGGGAVTGLTAKDMLEGRSLGQQFDIRTDEGMNSVLGKALAFAFTAQGALRAGAKMRKVAGRADAEAQHFLEMEAGPTSERLRALKKAAFTPIGMDDFRDALRVTDDVARYRMARKMRIPVLAKWLLPEEIKLRQAVRTKIGERTGQRVERLNVIAPDRQLFTEEGRAAIENELGLARARQPGLARFALSESKRVGKITYDLIDAYQNDFPKPDFVPTEGRRLPTEGVLKNPQGAWYLKPIKVDKATPQQRQTLTHLMAKSDSTSKVAFQDVFPNPSLGTEVILRRVLRSRLGIEKGDFILKRMTKTLQDKGLGPWGRNLDAYVTGAEMNDVLKAYPATAANVFNEARADVLARTGMESLVHKMAVEVWRIPELKSAIEKGDLTSIAITHFGRQAFARMLDVQDKTGLPTGETWMQASWSDSQERGILNKVTKGMTYAYGADLPAEAGTMKWKAYQDWMAWKLDPKTAKIAGIERLSINEVAKRVGWKGGTKRLAAVAFRNAKRMRQTYDWGFTQAGLSLDRFLDEFSHRVVGYVKDGSMKRGIPLDRYLMSKGLSKVEARNYARLIWSISVPPSAKIVSEARRPSYEYSRRVTPEMRDALREITYEQNPLVMMDKFFRRVVRHAIKDPLIPYMQEKVNIIRQQTAANPGPQKRLMKSLSWMLDSWFGNPTTIDRYLEGFHPFVKAMRTLRKVPLLKSVIPEPTIDNSGEFRTFLDYVTSGAYGVTLGYRPLSVLKNLTQSNHTAVVFGMKDYFSSLHQYLTDPAFRKEVDNLLGSVRYQYLDVSPEMATRAKNLISRFTKLGISPFRAADTFNVIGAVSSWLRGYNEAMDALKGDFSDVNKNLALEKMRFRRLKHGFLRRFLKQPGADPSYRKTYTGAQTMGDLIWEDLKAGNFDRAKLQGAKYFSYLTQYAYGGMEAAPAFRGSLNRLALMYMSWPLNYTEFLLALGRNQSGRQWLQLAVSWLALGSVLSAMTGKKAHRWFGVGPYPTELGLQSPVVGVAGAGYKIANTLASATQGWIYGAEDDYYLNNWASIVPQ